MNTKRSNEKIRRRKQRLKQINAKLSSPLKKKRRPELWIFIGAIYLFVLLILASVYEKQLSGWSWSYENLMLPVAVFAVHLLLLTMWFLPKFYVKSLQNRPLADGQSEFDREKEKLKLEDDTRKTVAQIAGGAVFLFGLIFTYNTFVLNREEQITDRFTKAVSQLGDKDIAVRLGGLYALERIANDSAKDHWTIMEILSAYIREKTPMKMPVEKTETSDQKKPIDPVPKEQIENEKITTDIQVALTIIGRRKVEQDPKEWRVDVRSRIDLSNVDFKKARLSGARLDRIVLVHSDLREVNLSKANLNHGWFDDANLRGAHLRGAIISEANFLNVDLTKANLEEADLKDSIFHMCGFREANLTNTNFENARLEYVNLRGVDLSKVKNLTFEQVKEAIIDENTILPGDLEPHRQELLEISKTNWEEIVKRFKPPTSQ